MVAFPAENGGHGGDFEDPEDSSLVQKLISDPTSSSCPIQALNEDLLVEILLRLGSIKLTSRCKCVCKRWFHLINPNPLSPNFIRMYLRRRKDPPPSFCLINVFACHPFHITTLKNNRAWFRSTAKEGFSLSFLPRADPSRIQILGSSNGLILCCPGRYDHSVYFICNPITKLWLSLPPPPLCNERATSFPDQKRGLIFSGLAFEEGGGSSIALRVNPCGRFRVVCVPATCDSSEFAVEVFSSESGAWDTCLVPRTDFPKPSTLGEVIVCNGIAFWMDISVFIAFNPWDSSSRLYPIPPNSRDNGLIAFCGQSQDFLRIITCCSVRDNEGPTYEIYTLKDYKSGEWCREHVIRLRQLVSTSNWLSMYAHKYVSYETGCLGFHPKNGDILYLRCKNHIVEVNMARGEWKRIDMSHESRFYDHYIVPLMLPYWPTPVPPTTTMVDRDKHQIQIPLCPKNDLSVTMMAVEEKAGVTYNDVGGCREQIEQMKEAVELPCFTLRNF